MKFVVSCVFSFSMLLISVALADDAAKKPTPNVFDLPRVQMQYQALNARITALFQKRDFAEAEKTCLAAIELVPYDASAHYNLACSLVQQDKIDEGLKALDRAVELGFTNINHIVSDKDFEKLKGNEGFAKIIDKARTIKPDPDAGWKQQVKPGAIENGEAWIKEQNTLWDTRIGIFRVFFAPVEQVKPREPIVKGYGQAGDQLRKWFDAATASGNHGDLYDNHDGDHSNMDYGAFPQIARIEYSDGPHGPKSRNMHSGLQTMFFFNRVTIGNSSTAMVNGPYWRSQPRLALTNARTAGILFAQYMGNHLYFYPEHRDHDPGHNGNSGGYGDVYSTNTPYVIISQGSSGSDRVFMNAIAATLAAFRPDVKEQLTKTGLLMPTIQMIFRMSNKPVQKAEDYLTGAAHPTVFDGKNIDELKMVELAHSMVKEKLPPIAGLRVIEEDKAKVGLDYFDAAEREVLFDTPCVVARVARSLRHTRRMVVSAEPSKDVNNLPLTYHWAVLRGDGDRIKIKKLNETGSLVEILIPYHERFPISPGSDMESNRVDIGAFVHNGTHYSAPAFITTYYLDNEKRTYDKEGRIAVCDYADAAKSLNYVDPMLDLPKDWRDEYHYGDDGKLTGWTRQRGKDEQQFTADGLLIVKRDEQGNATATKVVQYVPRQRQNQGPALEQQIVEAKE